MTQVAVGGVWFTSSEMGQEVQSPQICNLQLFSAISQRFLRNFSISNRRLSCHSTRRMGILPVETVLIASFFLRHEARFGGRSNDSE